MKLIVHQVLAVIPVLLVKFMTGIGIGWVAPMLQQLKDSPETAFTSEQCAWIAAGHYVTRGFCPFLVVFMIDRLGRNATLILSSFISFVMWIIVYSSRMVYVHYAVRLFFGISVGFFEAASAVYLGENCSTKLRGIFNGLCSAFFYFGELVAFLLAAYLSYEWVAICNCALGFVVLVSTVLLREPAQYLIMKGCVTKAEKNYHYLYDLRKLRTKLEFEDIKQYVNEVQKRKFSWRLLRSREVMKSLKIVLVANFICLGGGFTAVNSFVTIALANSPATNISTFDLTVLFGGTLFLSVLISSAFMDTFNRRTLFLFSSAAIVVNHAAIAALYYVNNTIQEIPYFSWLLFTLLTIFSSLVGMFIQPLTTAITGELLSQDVKAVGSSLAVVSSSIGGFVGAKIFLPISDSFGIHVNFILFSFVNLILFLYVYVNLPETKGKTLVDIQRELKSKTDKNSADGTRSKTIP